jgi:Fe-coproporphyrin III synthase
MLSKFKNPVILWEKGNKMNFRRMANVACFELTRMLFRKPYIAEIDVTGKCNLRCKHCFYFKNPEYIPEKELDIDTWKTKLKSLHKQGIRRLCLVGGEPALRMEAIELANGLFPYIDICSNGIIKIPEHINHRIFISIDGNDDYNQKYRSRKIMDDISENYYNDKRVVILMTLNGKNYNQINEVAEYAIKNKFDSMVFSLYTPFSEDDELYFDENMRKKIIEAIKNSKKKYPDLLKINRFVINWYAKSNHKNKCYWRDNVKHYNAMLEERKACLSMNCAYCGYFSGANIAPLNLFYRADKKINT